jgi:hypothetical protein
VEFCFSFGSKAFLYREHLFSLLLNFVIGAGLASFPELGSVVSSEKGTGLYPSLIDFHYSEPVVIPNTFAFGYFSKNNQKLLI